jgi:hypothetical protein
MMKRIVIVLAALILSLPTITMAAPVVFEASGASPADIQTAVDGFRTFWVSLTQLGSLPDGRDQLGWRA